MIAEQRHYTIVSTTILMVGFGLLGVFGWLSIRLWPVLRQALAPTTVPCGCSVMAVQSPWWLTGLAVGLMLVFAYSLVQMTRRAISVFRTTKALSRRWQTHQYRVVKHEGLQENVRVLSSSEPLALTLGFFHPTIYLSEGLLRTIRHSEVEAVIRHERAHRRAFDPLMALLLETLTAGWHWIPGVRGVMQAVYAQREVAADAVATDGYRSVTALSGAFLALQGVVHHPAVAAFSPNQERLEKLLDREWKSATQWWKRRTIISLVSIIGGVLFMSNLATAGTTVPPRATVMCHQAMIMCRQSPTATTAVQSCLGMTCVTLEHYSTPAYASSR